MVEPEREGGRLRFEDTGRVSNPSAVTSGGPHADGSRMGSLLEIAMYGSFSTRADKPQQIRARAVARNGVDWQ